MLAKLLALAMGFGSFGLYMAAFFFPEVHRKQDFFWSGVGLFYGLILWFCAGQMTGALLLGQTASVALLAYLGWHMLILRRSRTPVNLQTPVTQAEIVPIMGGLLGSTLAFIGQLPGFSKIRALTTGTQKLAREVTQPVPTQPTVRSNQRPDQLDTRLLKLRARYQYEYLEDIPQQGTAVAADELEDLNNLDDLDAELERTQAIAKLANEAPAAKSQPLDEVGAVSPAIAEHQEPDSAVLSSHSDDVDAIIPQATARVDESLDQPGDPPVEAANDNIRHATLPIDSTEAPLPEEAIPVTRQPGAVTESPSETQTTLIRPVASSSKPLPSDISPTDVSLTAPTLDSSSETQSPQFTVPAKSLTSPTKVTRKRPTSPLQTIIILTDWIQDWIGTARKPKSKQPMIKLPPRPPSIPRTSASTSTAAQVTPPTDARNAEIDVINAEVDLDFDDIFEDFDDDSDTFPPNGATP